MPNALHGMREKKVGEPLEFEDIRDLLINHSSVFDVGGGENRYSDRGSGGVMEDAFGFVEYWEGIPEVFDIDVDNFELSKAEVEPTDVPYGESAADLTGIHYSFDLSLDPDRSEIREAMQEGDYGRLSRDWQGSLRERFRGFDPRNDSIDDRMEDYIEDNGFETHVKGKVLVEGIGYSELETYADVEDHLARDPVIDLDEDLETS